jgi:hypothetical protein
MQIDLHQLATAIDVIARHLVKHQMEHVQITEDYYWEVSESDMFDMSKVPANLAVGQLTHDWERIQRIAAGVDEPTGYALTWIASVLRALGPATGV